ncbi:MULTISPECIES: hypothetical protein [unclassified Caballeronia]|uniref:nickel/cobalt transporter n=1 Tax=unclassified Caballeronia TaxID=2646786 RepID=UPI002857604E|nr:MULTISPECIES: hypothetical protein [unclassified Caballeronia]MDR5777408.1 hypothetical protein [Caballeronia sp. LZ002]MDR5852848.1 hypothetical protein [Caballeronia sp. LZ003]
MLIRWFKIKQSFIAEAKRDWLKFMSALTVFAILMGSPIAAFAQTVDVFGRTSTGAPVSSNDGVSAAKAARAETVGASAVELKPEWLRWIEGTNVRWQGMLNEHLMDLLTEAHLSLASVAALAMIALSFGYGVLHAFGPGHGKLVITTLLATRRTNIRHAVLLSAWGALCQALSAIALVGVAALLAKYGFGDVLTTATKLELMSYLALLAVGGWSVWSLVTHRSCCAPSRARLAPISGRVNAQCTLPERSESQQASSEGAYLGLQLARIRSASRETVSGYTHEAKLTLRQSLTAGLAIGVRPCAGSIFVLLSALDQQRFFVGVISALAMSFGVALTVCLIGLTSRHVNRELTVGKFNLGMRAERIQRKLALGGALIVTGFAAWQVVSLAIGWRAPTLM